MEDISIFNVYSGKTIPQIIVESFTDMTSGVTGSISEAFDKLVLNESGTGLSMLAIWTLSFLGVGFIWKVVPIAVRFLRRRRA